MAILVSLPLFLILVILQAGILSHITLLQSSADIILLVILSWSLQERVKTAWQWAIIGGVIANFATNLPFGTLPIVYSTITAIGLLLRHRIWKAPILSMIFGTIIGTVILFSVSYLMVTLNGVLIPLIETINLVILPGILLNLLLALPVFYLVRDLANWIYPEELDS